MRKYCDIENLYKNNEEIFKCKSVICLEKLHGTNIRIGAKDRLITIGGRNTILTSFLLDEEDYVDVDTLKIENDSYGFVRWFIHNHFKALQRLASYSWVKKKEIILFGEFIGPSIQKGVNYGKERDFYVFDSWEGNKDTDNELQTEDEVGQFNSWLDTYDYAKGCDLKRVPCLFAGPPDLEAFKKLYEQNSVVGILNGVEGTNICEGIVIQPAEGDIRDHRGNRVIAKFKNDKFAEVAKQKKSREVINTFKEQEFVDTFVLPERLNHVLQRLREDEGLIVTDMTSTKKVIDGMMRDLKKECSEELSEINENKAMGLAAKRTAELLKEYLCL